MKVKRYIGNNNQDAISKLRDDLGMDAIIINTRKIRQKGFFGFFKKPLTEVVGALDDQGIKPVEATVVKKADTKLEDQTINQNKAVEELQQQFINMEFMVKSLAVEISQKKPDLSADRIDRDSLTAILMKNEISEEYSEKIAREAKRLAAETNISLKNALATVIVNILGEPQPLNIEKGKQKVILFIGPTGVGKTTTLAKMAAILSIQQQLNVGLITADTYRIAAVDQLRTYAEILDIPLSIIYSPVEVTRALDDHRAKDVVLIDTAGKGMTDSTHEKEISTLVQLSSAEEIYLVISANISFQSCQNIINRYRFLDKYKLIFTKLDDAASWGNIINCCMMCGNPMTYVTNGQNVPDDIDVADSLQITKHLLESVNI